ncbi:eCIS core domain-containing protein [Aquimarina sediminis]|uniref:eCIS core domain-containing protein n=1 Tax=Aquimarina sediminis TaxID=2070536 RepID=UPI000CA0401F|nr:DUF4157 domain-containing protein [Aquimarina sediminis]
MKTAEKNSTTTAKSHIQAKQEPFFAKEGQGNFFSKSNETVTPFFEHTSIQPKLTIGQPNDKYEVEADAMADQVVQKLSSTETNGTPVESNKGGSIQTEPIVVSKIQTKCSTCEQEEKLQKKEEEVSGEDVEIQRKPIFESNSEQSDIDVQTKPLVPCVQTKCASCEQEEKLQKKEEEQLEEEESIQQKSIDSGGEVKPDLQNRLHSSKGGGSSLPSETQSSMGAAFGADFSNVRIHTGSESVQMNRELGAQAFTNGSDIYFNDGKYNTNSRSGKHLLAHELTHTVQQGAIGIHPKINLSPSLSTSHFKGNYSIMSGKSLNLQASFLDDVGSAFSAGADFVSDAAGDAVDWAGETIGDALELGADAIMAIVRRVSPGLAELIENGPLQMISEALNGGIQSWLAGVFSELGIGEFIEGLKGNFESAFLILQGIVNGDEASCEAFNQAIQGIREFISDFMNNPFFEAIREVFTQVKNFLSEMFDLLIAPILDTVIELMGEAFSVVRDIATTVWGWLQTVKSYMESAWDWVMEQLGFTGEGEDGIWNHFKEFASDIWNEIKTTFEPIIGPLQTILTILLVISPVGPMYITIMYGPRIVEAIQWLWNNKDNPNIIRDAREQMGDSILPQLLEAGEAFVNEISGAVDMMMSQFVELSSALLEFIGSVTGIPLLDMAKSFVETISTGVQDFISWGQEKLQGAVNFFKTIFNKIKTVVQPYMEIITSIGMAILNPPMIPIILAGWAWRALPNCYKPPIIDFLLDGIIAFLEALPMLPMMGPLWPLLKTFVIGFLQGFRERSDDEKIAVTNKLAKIISGASIDFIIGFVIGFLKGVWEGLTDPFVLIYQILNGLNSLISWFYGVMTQDTSPENASQTDQTAGTPAGSQQAMSSRMREMGEELEEPIGQVTGNFQGAITEHFEGGEGMTFESLSQKLGDMWSRAETAIRGAGSSLAESVVTFMMADDSERKIGEGVGWLAGTIVFEVVLGILTAGAYGAASTVAKLLDWTGEALGAIFKIIGKLGKHIVKLFDKIMEMASHATGALRIVMDALKEIGEKLMRFSDELFGRFGRGAASEATERTAREVAEASSERAAREGVEETAEETAEEVAERTARETGEETGERGAREGVDDATKAAELPAAIAAARTLTETQDAIDTPALVTVGMLNGIIKPQYRWIEHFEARPKGGLGRYSVHMIASDHEVDSSYTEDRPAPGAPGSPEHKSRRWQEYQDRGGEWTYERWSKQYEVNMRQAPRANAAMDAYHQKLGWGEREVTVDAGGQSRRLDIADADPSVLRGIEHKTGYQTANQHNLSEVARDKILQDNQGWEITWVFEGTASQPLLKALRDAGIPYRFE